MRASYTDFVVTPLSVIMRDLEFNKYENQVRNAKSQQQNNSVGNK